MTTRLATILITLALLSPRTVAQIDRLDRSIVTSAQLDQPALEQIDRFVSEHAQMLSGEGPAEMARASQELRRPLENAAASVAFRSAYSAALMPTLTGFVTGDRVETKMVAMRLAGELATDDAFALLTGAVDSDSQADRVFACGRLARAFGVLKSNPTPTANPALALRAIETLGPVVADGGSIEADAAVRALNIAATIKHGGFEEVTSAALRTLASRSAARARAADPSDFALDELTVLMHACVAGRDAIISPPSPDRETTIEVIGLSADLIALVYARFQAGEIDADDRHAEVQVLREAENALLFARRHLGERVDTSGKLADVLDSGDDRAFPTRVLALIGSSGELVRRYGFDPERFNRAP